MRLKQGCGDGYVKLALEKRFANLICTSEKEKKDSACQSKSAAEMCEKKHSTSSFGTQKLVLYQKIKGTRFREKEIGTNQNVWVTESLVGRKSREVRFAEGFYMLSPT